MKSLLSLFCFIKNHLEMQCDVKEKLDNYISVK